jgi:hypothetical protein
MTRRCFIDLVSMTFLATLTVRPAQAIRVGDDDGSGRFKRSVDDYVNFRRELDRRLPPLQTTADGRRIHDAVEARAAAIRRARSRAKQGDMFNAEVSALFRTRIREVFAGHPDAVEDLLREMTEYDVWQPPVVNGRFSWVTAVATPPSVLSVLPGLPDPLQYRFVGTHLVIVDVDADLVLDVLPAVLILGPLVGRGHRQAADVKGYGDSHVMSGDGTAGEADSVRPELRLLGARS